MFKKRTALTPRRLFEALRTAGQNLIMIALACAGAGMVVAIVTHTGLALGIATVINNWSGGHLLPALMLIMVTSLVLGMGMPCTPAYIIAVTVGGPALVALGTDLLASHLLVFYFAILAEVTPPVCIPAYCAASIAHAKPLQTGFEAFKLAIVAFIVPYIFVYNPALLLKGNVGETISLVLVMLFAIVFLSAAITAFFFKKLTTMERLAMGVAAAGGIILSAHREIVGHPATLTAVLFITMTFFAWGFLRERKAAG
jgi:TRAP-type uncharacterized transport system fused permease subunit